ncbi:hypothetical protein HEP84_55180 [Streptomyces sp. RLB1-33]|nr:hypothetical protein [Streptomyces sp. RLB1-33]
MPEQSGELFADDFGERGPVILCGESRGDEEGHDLHRFRRVEYEP